MKKLIFLLLIIIMILTLPSNAVVEPYFSTKLTGPVFTGDYSDFIYTVEIGDIGAEGLIGYDLEVTYDPQTIKIIRSSISNQNVPFEWDESTPAIRIIDNSDGTKTCIIRNYDAFVDQETYAIVTNEMPKIMVSFKFSFVEGYTARNFDISVLAKGTKLDANKNAISVVGDGSFMSVFIGSPDFDINDDDKIDILDMIELKKWYKDVLEKVDYSHDYNCDGRINDDDTLYLQQKILGIVP